MLAPAVPYSITYYEHLITQTFNSTSYFGTVQSSSFTFASGNTTKAWNFTKDVTETSPNGLLIPIGTLSFNGSFKANTNQDKNDVYINWQVVEYNSTSSAETEICRTPINTSGQLVSSTSAQNLSANCAVTSNYVVRPGNYLRVNIYGYNKHPSQSRGITHYWDNSAYPSAYTIQQLELGNLSINITSPSVPMSVPSTHTFNITCNATCTGGSCIDISVFADFKPPSGSWQAIGSSGNIILNGTETNPHNIGDVSAFSSTTFIVLANTMSDDNVVRCRAESIYSNATGQTEVQVNITDGIFPAISIQFPGNSSYNMSMLDLNFTVNDTAVDSCWYFLNGTGPSALPGCANMTLGPLADGAYNLTVYVNDTANNTNFSSLSFTVDTSISGISIQSPQNITYTTDTIDLNFTVSDNSIDKCWYIMNGGSDISLPGCINADITASEGPNNITVYVNDTAGNQNSSSVSFSVDTIPPSVSIQSPTNSTYNSTSIDLNFTVSGEETCWYILNAGSPVYGCANTNITGTEGSNSITVYANDSANNINSSSVNFSVDTVPPGISIQSPTNSTFNTTSIDLNFTVSGEESCWYILNADSPVYGCTNTSITGTEGSNTITVYANDSANNINSSSVSFSVDTIPPSISIQSPTNSTFNTTSIDLNFTVSGEESCWYILNADSPVYGCTNASISGTEGFNSITAFANDSVNNINSTSINFSVDTIPPGISIQSPANKTYNSTSIDLNFTVSGEESCWYILNADSPVYGCSNTSITATEGSNSITVYANDSANNINSSSVSFSVDTIPPSISIQSPINTTYTTSSVKLNFTVSGAQNCWYYLNGVGPTILPGCANTTLGPLSNGAKNLTLFANDSIGNRNSTTVLYTINIVTPPLPPSGGSGGGGAGGGGGGGVSVQLLTVSWAKICPGNGLQINVSSGSQFIKGAEVLIIDPSGAVSTRHTDQNGQVIFTDLTNATYRFNFSLYGFRYDNPLVVDYTTCAKPGCSYQCCSDSDCAGNQVCKNNECASKSACQTNDNCTDDEQCSNGECIPVETKECGYVANHSWYSYACCADKDCMDYPYARCADNFCIPKEFTLQSLNETAIIGERATISVYSDGETASDIDVLIKSPSGKISEAVTDENGEFTFVPYAEGLYNISAFGPNERILAQLQVFAIPRATPECYKLMGVCWYWWVAIALTALFIIFYVVYRKVIFRR